MSARRIRRRHPCVLCGRRAAICDLFSPYCPQDWGAPLGADRLLIVRICTTCYRLPDRNEKVESAVAALLAAGAYARCDLRGASAAEVDAAIRGMIADCGP